MIQQTTRGTPRADLGQAFMEFDPALANFIATQVFPVLPVDKKTATFFKVTRESMLKRASTKRGKNGSYNRIDIEGVDDTYKCQEDGLEAVLGDDERAEFRDDFDAELAKTQQLWMKIMIELEVAAKDALFNTTSWPSGTAALFTNYSTAPWDAAGSDVITQVKGAVEKVRQNCGMTQVALVCSKVSVNNLTNNTYVKARFPGATAVTQAMLEGNLSAIFGVDKLIVGKQVYDSAKEGQDFSGADIWPDDYASVAVIAPDGSPMRTPCVGRTVLWTPDSPELYTVDEYREEQTRSDVFRGRRHSVVEVIDPYFAHLLQVDAM